MPVLDLNHIQLVKLLRIQLNAWMLEIYLHSEDRHICLDSWMLGCWEFIYTHDSNFQFPRWIVFFFAFLFANGRSSPQGCRPSSSLGYNQHSRDEVKCGGVWWCRDEEGEETGAVLFDCGSVIVDFVFRSLTLN